MPRRLPTGRFAAWGRPHVGPGQFAQMENETLFAWLRAADRTSTWTTSVCTGSLILAGAGLLEGRRATSHWLALDFLKQYGAEPAR